MPIRFVPRPTPDRTPLIEVTIRLPVAALQGYGRHPRLLEDRVPGIICLPRWVDFYLVAATPKDVAIEAGVQLAYSIADVMKVMLPIYTAAVSE